MSVSNDNIIKDLLSKKVKNDISFRNENNTIDTGSFSLFVDGQSRTRNVATYSGSGVNPIPLSITGLVVGERYMLTSNITLSRPAAASNGAGVRILDVSTGSPNTVIKAHPMYFEVGFDDKQSFTDVWTTTATATTLDLNIDLFVQGGTDTISVVSWEVILRSI